MNPVSGRWFALLVGSTVLALILPGCATSDTYKVKVDAITKPTPGEAQSYKLKSKDPRLGEENLRYREAAEYVRTALSGKGLYEAPSEEKADMIVELDYGMDTPRAKLERVSVPVYAQVGGRVRYESVPVTDSRGNSGFRTVAVYDPPRNELVGYDDVPRMVTIYEKYLKITARENKAASEGRPPAELWSIHASAEDESKDLRKYLPIMASATVDYIGQDSSSQKVVKVRADGPGVDFIRRGVSTPAVETPKPAPAPKS
ncbi:hypothetical protein [Horticoccus sp. 23ND18S-11]|uniref:hypothetical protein n=1 Tax=Horticoccus sp. 23ND18S-11 TaxID=3391832 RepID=UPI0039C99A58